MGIQSSSSPSLQSYIAQALAAQDNGTSSKDNIKRDTAQDPLSGLKQARYPYPDGGGKSALPGATSLLPEDTAIDDGVTNVRRAPSLYVPQSLSPIDVMTQLSILNAKSSEESGEVTKSNIMVTKNKLDQNIKLVEANQKEAAEKAAQAAKSQRAGKIFGWIGKVAAVVTSAVAVMVTGAAAMATGGLATPLLVMAVASLVGSTLSLADQISQEVGGPKISLSGALSKVTMGVLEAFNVDPEKAQKISDIILDIATPALLLLEPDLAGRLATRICDLVDISPDTAGIIAGVANLVAAAVVIVVNVAVAIASGGTSALSSVTRALNFATLSVGGTAQIGAGASGLTTAILRKDGDLIRATVTELKASNLNLQRQMKNDQESLQALLQSVQDGLQSASQVLKDVFDNMSQIMNNMSRRAPA